MQKKIIKLFHEIYNKKISPEEAFEKLKFLPFEDIIHTKIDFHRKLRTNIEEIIFGENKTITQLIEIIELHLKNNQDILITRVSNEKGKILKEKFIEGNYNEIANIFYIRKEKKSLKGNVSIITAGTSDIPVAEEAYETLKFLGSNAEKIYDVGIAGIHRLIEYKEKILKANIIIAIAGMEGALPSVIAGIFGKPVIGVPTSIGYGANFNGIAPLLTMLNSCAPGIAVVNINNGVGAGIFAHMINIKISQDL